jgi:hypothetical protein
MGALTGTTTATTIDIPINMRYQIVDNGELIERIFVEDETQKAVNPILNYDKVRFVPLDKTSRNISNITYSLSFLNANNTLVIPSNYSDIGYDNDDIKFERNNFKESYLNLAFYDSDNALTQNLVTEIEIYSFLDETDYWKPGSTPTGFVGGLAKPASQIQVKNTVSNPLTMAKADYEGFYIYNYKDEYTVGLPKYLYMKGTYYNAKNGKITNLMTEPTKKPIEQLVNTLYTKYKLYRTTTGFYYVVDDTYSTNVTYTNSVVNNTSDVLIKLYQIQAL